MKLRFALVFSFFFLVSYEKNVDDYRDKFIGTYEGKYEGSFTLSIPDSTPETVSGIDCEIVVTKGIKANVISLNYSKFYQDRTISGTDNVEIEENGVSENWGYKS